MNGISNWFGGVSTAWDKFWFMPRSGKSLGLIRLLTGLMVFWTHLILSLIHISEPTRPY